MPRSSLAIVSAAVLLTACNGSSDDNDNGNNGENPEPDTEIHGFWTGTVTGTDRHPDSWMLVTDTKTVVRAPYSAFVATDPTYTFFTEYDAPPANPFEVEGTILESQNDDAPNATLQLNADTSADEPTVTGHMETTTDDLPSRFELSMTPALGFDRAAELDNLAGTYDGGYEIGWMTTTISWTFNANGELTGSRSRTGAPDLYCTYSGNASPASETNNLFDVEVTLECLDGNNAEFRGSLVLTDSDTAENAFLHTQLYNETEDEASGGIGISFTRLTR